MKPEPRVICSLNAHYAEDPEKCIGVDFRLTDRELTELTLDEIMDQIFRPCARMLVSSLRRKLVLDDSVAERARFSDPGYRGDDSPPWVGRG